MVSESDYDFVVKAAKKFNFEFFVDRGRIYFRKAKSNTTTLMTIGSGKGLRKFNVGYSLTGLVATVEARAMDAGQGKIITAKEKYPEAGKSISTGNQAKKLLGDGTKVYIDPTIKSQSQAEARAAALKEQMSYRLGNLEGTCVGLPDLVPGRFIKLSGLGGPTENRFYLTEVVHDFDDQRGFETRITGCANQVGGMDL
jgi:phage protein D